VGGLRKDDEIAVGWYRKAAEAGSALAMSNLGVMYQNGAGGLPKDIDEARRWHKKAAALGFPCVEARSAGLLSLAVETAIDQAKFLRERIDARWPVDSA